MGKQDLYTIDNWFLHRKLAMHVLGSADRGVLERKLKDAKNYTANIKEIFINSAFTTSIVSYLAKNKVVSLEERLLKKDVLKKGELIWFQNNFYFKGIDKAKKDFKKGIKPAYSFFNITLKRYGNLYIKGKFNFEHIFGNSSSVQLSGHKTKFVFAYIDKASDKEIILRPIIIGDKIFTDEAVVQLDSNSLLVNIEDIDEFKKVASISFSDDTLDININKNIPERDIKKLFAEILNEGNVPDDWGGENSDLFTNHIHIKGKRYNGAFLLKGPSKFHEMSTKDLGKNGDQIVRLFDEPADVFIVQHCHYVKQDIYKTMEAFSSRFDKTRRYCIINGIDTLRILKAYGKL